MVDLARVKLDRLSTLSKLMLVEIQNVMVDDLLPLRLGSRPTGDALLGSKDANALLGALCASLYGQRHHCIDLWVHDPNIEGVCQLYP